MKKRIKIFLIIVVPLFAFTTAHKYYMSVTNINYLEKEKILQVTSRIFIDDFENLLKERYNITGELATPNENENANFYIEKYIQQKFIIKINEEVAKFNFVGKEYDNDIMICYMEFPNVEIETPTVVEIQNSILIDLFAEQQNIVHFKLRNTKKSVILIRENNKRVLKL